MAGAIKDQRAEGLKRMIKGYKAHIERIQTQLDAHETKKKEEAMAKLFKEDINYPSLYFGMKEERMLSERDEKMIGRYRIVHNTTGEILGSHDDRSEAIALGKKCGGHPNVRLVDTEKD